MIIGTRPPELTWTVEALLVHVERELDAQKAEFFRTLADLRTLLQERYESQLRAIGDGFEASNLALSTATTAAQTALDKAETSTDRRLEALSDLRIKLADHEATYLSRLEIDERFTAVGARITELADRAAGNLTRGEIDSRLTATNSRLDVLSTSLASRLESIVSTVSTLSQTMVSLRSTLAGQEEGANEQLRAADRRRNLFFAVVGVIFVIITIAVSLYLGFHNHPITSKSAMEVLWPSSKALL